MAQRGRKGRKRKRRFVLISLKPEAAEQFRLFQKINGFPTYTDALLKLLGDNLYLLRRVESLEEELKAARKEAERLEILRRELFLDAKGLELWLFNCLSRQAFLLGVLEEGKKEGQEEDCGDCGNRSKGGENWELAVELSELASRVVLLSSEVEKALTERVFRGRLAGGGDGVEKAGRLALAVNELLANALIREYLREIRHLLEFISANGEKTKC
jgi:hypothetical protein